MLKRMRSQLTYANVIATIALFVALGGTSYAAITITGKNVKNRSLTYKDLKRNTLGGSRIRESRLGKVKRAKRADRLGGHSGSFYRDRCPGGTRSTTGSCIDIGVRGTAGYQSARVTCDAAGRRLPTHQELANAVSSRTVGLSPGGEVTGDVVARGDGNVNYLLVIDGDGGARLAAGTENHPFRCITDRTN